MYDAQADTINVDDIAKNSNNRRVLRRLKNECTDHSLWIRNDHVLRGQEGVLEYRPEGAHDMGWLGYFVGKNDHLQKLVMTSFTPTSEASVRDVLEPFLRGVCCNKSIPKIGFVGMDLLGGEVFTMLGPFFQNCNLTIAVIDECDFGDEGWRLFSLAIGSCTNKSLREVQLKDNNIVEEGMWISLQH